MDQNDQDPVSISRFFIGANRFFGDVNRKYEQTVKSHVPKIPNNTNENNDDFLL